MSDLLHSAGARVRQRGASLAGEFKAFALKGNAIELAVGVVIGGAFGKVVDALVKNIIMPAISLIMPGEQGYREWKLIVGEKEVPYGLFLGELLNFLIVALALFFFVVKFLGFVMRTKQKAAEAPEAAEAPALTMQEELLVEIRDLLREQKAG